MMRGHRKLLFLSLFLIVVTAAGIVVYQRVARPARAVLLLPDGNFLLYVNFSPAHFFDLGQMPMESDPEYQDFLQQTGFHFEHDLDTIAISQRKPGDMNSESSAVFVGSFDRDRISRYLQRLSNGTESYGDRTIFSIPQEGHTVRASILDAKTVAVTNMNSPEPMHSIIDKSRAGILASSAPSLVRDYYGYVPFASVGWAIFRDGFNTDFLQNTVSVISLRYAGSIRLKAEVISKSENDAARVLQAFNTFLVIAKGAGESLSAGGQDKDVKAVFDNIQVQQNGNRTVLSVVLPPEFVRKMAAQMNH
jgi:hypothetical protein